MVSESTSFNDVANSSFAELMRLTREGDLGLGVEIPEHKLDVAGTIRATEILVEAQTADFVFDDDYNLRDLAQIEEFIKEQKHLPDIPSAAQMVVDGVNLAEMNKLLLMKIEELTLYIIQQDKRIEMLEQKSK